MNRYQSIPTLTINKKPVYQTVRYPNIELNENDWYVTSTQGDRFDILALDFYQDETLWWIISIANNTLKQNSLVVPEGIQIRIPADVAGIINEYKRINNL